jgi:sugar/nucleoside kinase (ribokinase family)
VTIGPAGAIAVSDTARESVPAPAVHAVDTTGAGDAFVGSFAAALAIDPDDISAALQAAVWAGSSATTSWGPLKSLELPEPGRAVHKSPGRRAVNSPNS